MILWKYDETQRLYTEMLETIKPYVRYEHDFESLEPYLTVFDEVPSKEKEQIIEYFVRMVWSYKDSKRKGIQKKSIKKLENSIKKYQEAIRELHNVDASDEVIFRNGNVYSYDGDEDFDDDFDINLYLCDLPQKLKDNYLTNIEILKEIEYLRELQYAMKFYYIGMSKTLKEKPKEISKHFKLIDPTQFYEMHRPSKKHIKETLYSYAMEYNIPNYLMKQLIDAI